MQNIRFAGKRICRKITALLLCASVAAAGNGIPAYAGTGTPEKNVSDAADTAGTADTEEPSGTVTPSETPSVSPSVSPSETSSPSETPSAVPDTSETPSPSAVPSETVTPVPETPGTVTGTEGFTDGTPYRVYTADSADREKIKEQFPETLLFTEEGKTGTHETEVTWSCAEDYTAENVYSFRFSAVLPDGYSYADGTPVPYVTVNIRKYVTGFAGADGNGTWDGSSPYAVYDTQYLQKSAAHGDFPQYVWAYINGNSTAEKTDVSWTCTEDITAENKSSYTYSAEVTGAEVPAGTKTVPYIRLGVTDYRDFSAENADYVYTGNVQTYRAPKTGKYRISMYGASGGGVLAPKGGSVGSGGYGGYTEGYINLTAGQKLYIQAGQAGSRGGGASWNGGGAGSGAAGSGGGATSITLSDHGQLSGFSQYRNDVAAVAGGGGGIWQADAYHNATGSGGAESGGSTVGSTAGTASAGYAFGSGQNAAGGGAGGGGWYGGYASHNPIFGGAGGSGYTGGLYNASTSFSAHEGNGSVSVSYEGEVKSTLTIRAGNHASYGGRKGTTVIEGDYGDTYEFLTPVPDSGFTADGWETISGNAVGGETYTFGDTDSEVKLLYSAPLLLTADTTSMVSDRYVKLHWEEDDTYTKNFVLSESTDGNSWYACAGSADIRGDGLGKTITSAGISSFTPQISGFYRFQLWGARGASGYGSGGGYGTYMVSTVFLNAGQTVYVQVGNVGGWNGGGAAASGYSYGSAGNGGGATSVTLANRGTLSAFAQHTDEVLLVAGGGGGGGGGGSRGWDPTNGGGGGASGYTGYPGGRGGDMGAGTTCLNGNGGGGGGQNGGGGGGSTGYHHSHGADHDYYAGGGGGGGGGWFGGGGGGSGFMDYESWGRCHGNNGGGGSFGQGGNGGWSFSSYAWHAGPGGGGGGGSSYANPSYASDTSYSAGAAGGNGQCIITALKTSEKIDDSTVGIYVKDILAPTAPTECALSDPGNGKLQLTWNESQDRGLTYYFRADSYLTGSSTPYRTSDTVKADAFSGLKGYLYILDSTENTAIGSAQQAVFSYDPYVQLTEDELSEYLYIHTAAVDYAGNISGTYTYRIPLPYYIVYNSNTASDSGQNVLGGMADTETRDPRIFSFGTSYTLQSLQSLGQAYTKTGTGFYGQKIGYAFAGWGLKSYTPYTGNTREKAEAKDLLNAKVQNFMTGDPPRLADSTKTSAADRPYFLDGDTFYSLTVHPLSTVKLYAEWIAENQRPYCGFRLLSEKYNDDGTGTGTLKNIPYDSYDTESASDTADTAAVYDDVPVYISGFGTDPENMKTEGTEYQYSEDGGKTWYRLDGNSEPKTFAVSVRKTASGASAVGMLFTAGKTVLIRMRMRDTVKYPYTLAADGTQKPWQKVLWSTGYYYSPDISASDYNAGGLYAGDRGTEVSGGGSWYVKTVNCYKGNLAPESGLVASDTDADRTAQNYAELAGKTEAERYSVLPMYNFTEKGGDTSYLYSRGTLYVLLSSAENRALGGGTDAQLAEAWNRAHGNINSALYSGITFIKEGDARYTEYAPEDETAAYLDASSDPDAGKHTGKVQTPTWNYDKDWAGSYANTGSTEGHAQFAEYFVAVCRRDTFTDVTLSGSDRNTTYGTDGRATSGTLYTRPYTDASGKTRTVKGHIFQTYDEMVKYIRTSGADLFPADTDSTVTAYDIYYAVCDKSWNRISPNAWGAVKHYTELSEPWVTFGDITYTDRTAAVPQYAQPVSVYRNGGVPAYRIASYTETASGWQNVYTGAGRVSEGRAANSRAGYTAIPGKTFSENAEAFPKAGTFAELAVTLHGAEKFSAAFLKNGTVPEKLLYGENAGITENGGVLSENTCRLGRNGAFWRQETLKAGFPEQTAAGTEYILRITAEKTPYTGNGTPETRTVTAGSADRPFARIPASSLSDTGVQNTD